MKYENYDGILVNFAFVVQNDGLDEEGLKEELSEQVDVIDIQYYDEDTIFILKGTLADYWTIKLRYYCLEHPEQKYVLFPMASPEEKRKAKEMLGL